MQTRLPPLHSGTQADRAAHMLRSMAASGIDTAAALQDGLLLAVDDVAQGIAAETALATLLAITAELAKRHGE